MTLYALDGVSPTLPEDGDFWIAPDANIIGNVMLGAETSVWFGATLRGDSDVIRVGDGTNIQDNCVVHVDPGHPVTIGRNCTIGHKAMIHGCEIGDDTLVGMGATVLNGAKIGKGCLIGAGALVTEGKVIPDGSLVLGAPGKVVRDIGQQGLAGNRKSAETYRARMKLYRAGLESVAQ